MSAIEMADPDGATLLSPEELAELIPQYITTREELNVLEHENIQSAHVWLRKQGAIDVTEPGFFC